MWICFEVVCCGLEYFEVVVVEVVFVVDWVFEGVVFDGEEEVVY